ncbi:hypothetical protein TUMEXPCC7403_11595 [Tumidithrix helvetica PCC 7403]
MREIFTALLNVFVLIILVFLVGNIRISSAMQNLSTIQNPQDYDIVYCDISSASERTPRVVPYPKGTDCVAIGKRFPPPPKEPGL